MVGNTGPSSRRPLTPVRLDDWTAYVEYSLLQEFLLEVYPMQVVAWDDHVASGGDPNGPVVGDADDSTLREFNSLIRGGRWARPERTGPMPSDLPWANRVVHDIQCFHRAGYGVRGLVPAIGVYVDGRGSSGYSEAAYRQLHVVTCITENLHNTSSAVPPFDYNQWASSLEILFFRQYQATNGANTPSYGLLHWAMAWALGGKWMFLLPLLLASGAEGQPGQEHEAHHGLPDWLVTAIVAGRSLLDAGGDGPGLLGLLLAAARSRGVPGYTAYSVVIAGEFARLLEVPGELQDPGVMGQPESVGGVCRAEHAHHLPQ